MNREVISILEVDKGGTAHNGWRKERPKVHNVPLRSNGAGHTGMKIF